MCVAKTLFKRVRVVCRRGMSSRKRKSSSGYDRMAKKYKSRPRSIPTNPKFLRTRNFVNPGRTRVPDPDSNNIVSVKRMVNVGQWQSNTAAEADYGISFALSDLPGSDLTSLFDMYRFKKIIVHVIPRWTEYVPGSGVGPNYWMTAIDFDSSSTVDAGSIFQYDTCQIHQGNVPFQIEFKPRPQVVMAGSSGSGAAMAKKGLWLDCGEASLAHYGLLGVIPQASTTGQIWDLIGEYHMEFIKTR